MKSPLQIARKERPIIFSGAMVKAILEGKKTQTRRVVKPQPGDLQIEILRHNRIAWPCPYGQPGDKLWVREAFAYKADPTIMMNSTSDCVRYRVDCVPDDDLFKWRPSIHMPRWASRITLEIVSVRVERVQEISHEDAIAEGMGTTPEFTEIAETNYRTAFEIRWDIINAERGYGWDKNPWVWVIEFRRITP